MSAKAWATDPHPRTLAPAWPSTDSISRRTTKSSSTTRTRAPLSSGFRSALSPCGIEILFRQRQLDRAHQAAGQELAADDRAWNGILDQTSAQPGRLHLYGCRATRLAPDKVQRSLAVECRHAPRHADVSRLLCQCTVFRGVGGQLMQHQAERRGELRRQ